MIKLIECKRCEEDMEPEWAFCPYCGMAYSSECPPESWQNGRYIVYEGQDDFLLCSVSPGRIVAMESNRKEITIPTLDYLIMEFMMTQAEHGDVWNTRDLATDLLRDCEIYKKEEE